VNWQSLGVWGDWCGSSSVQANLSLSLPWSISMCKFFATPFLGAVPHRDKDYYGIRSNFWKLYLIRTGFTLGEPVLWVKVFRLFRLERVFLGVLIALDPAFGSFTLLESVSHYVNRFYWWMCLDCLDWNGFFWGVQSVDTVGRDVCTTS
jgi:hypothetical protein